MKKLTKLNDSHRAAIRMKIEGRTCKEIAETVNVETRTVYLWFSDELVKAELENQRRIVFELFATRMSEVGLRAISGLEALTELELEEGTTLSVSEKLEIYREILDRIPFTSKSGRPGYDGTPSRPIPGIPNTGDEMGPPDSASDEELMRNLREVAQLVPGIAVMEPNGDNSS